MDSRSWRAVTWNRAYPNCGAWLARRKDADAEGKMSDADPELDDEDTSADEADLLPKDEIRTEREAPAPRLTAIERARHSKLRSGPSWGAEEAIQPIASAIGAVCGLATGIFSLWCTVIAFKGGTLPLIGVELQGGVAAGAGGRAWPWRGVIAGVPPPSIAEPCPSEEVHPDDADAPRGCPAFLPAVAATWWAGPSFREAPVQRSALVEWRGVLGRSTGLLGETIKRRRARTDGGAHPPRGWR